jgi:hypothetical protein
MRGPITTTEERMGYFILGFLVGMLLGIVVGVVIT